MSIIGKVGRKSFKVKSLSTTIHVILLLGAITMIYPFMMMISSSFKSSVDSKKFSVFPKYFYREEMLFKKYIEARYNENSVLMIEQYKDKFISFEFVEIPPKISPRKYADWREFISDNIDKHTLFDYFIAEQSGRGIYPRNERKFRNLMKQESGNNLDTFNKTYGTAVLSWDEVRVEENNFASRNFSGDYQGFLSRYEQFRQNVPLWHRNYISLDGHFINNELFPAYRRNLQILNDALDTDYTLSKNIILSRRIPQNNLKKHWVNYVKNIVNIHHVGVDAKAISSYHSFLKTKYREISLLNATYKTEFASFKAIEIPQNLPRSGAILVDWIFFIENVVDEEYLYLKSVEFDYRDWLEKKYVTVKNLNEVYANGFEDFSEIKLPSRYPTGNLKFQKDWKNFVLNNAADNSLQLLMTAQHEFLDYIRTENLDITSFNQKFATNFDAEINLYPTKLLPENSEYQVLWLKFVREVVSPQFIKVENEQQEWQKFLQHRYGSVTRLNIEYGLIYQNFDEISIDFWEIDYQVFQEHKKTIFNEFFKRNYVMVLDLMFYNGRAIINTLIYCLLSILVAIVVNPLAAYAMSRFKLKATYKIILILMLTMAFPPMVMGIPNFLLLKKFNLLNTFWALILPAAADGYFIFLLKGFFDSLPQELFESATIDGANEPRIFWQIAMSLSKPIMAVIALGAFNAAYRNFMFAFIVCQDKSMWTMMVHIYQLMQRSCAGVGFAALVIAAIPTFIVFVFFQNIIIRGIVVPTEK